MKCNNCGNEHDNDISCPYCGAKNEKVRVMSREEADRYDGLTLDAGTNQETHSTESSYSNGVKFKVYTLNSMGLLQKLLLGLVLVVMGIVATFAMLPMMIVLGAITVFFCLFRRELVTKWWNKAKSIYAFLRQFRM